MTSFSRILFGLIGHPIEHSQSPRLFKEYCIAHDPSMLKKSEYRLILEPDFDRAISVFVKDDAAINVTAPFKTRAYEWVVEQGAVTDPLCTMTKAVNCIIKGLDGSLRAYNTDCSAVASILRSFNAGPATRVAIAGSGGAGRSAQAACRSLGIVPSVFNRTVRESGQKSLEALAPALENCDILIYTLPVGGILRPSDIPSRVHVVEANYRDPHLDFHPLYTGGLEWLEEQGRICYEMFGKLL